MSDSLKPAYSVIIYNSNDLDSRLCKEIISAQYKYTYQKDIEQQDNRIVVYDCATDEASIKDFDLTKLGETEADNIFICGIYIDKTLIQQFIIDNENVYVFEKNPYKIKDIKTALSSYKYKYSNQMDLTMSMSMKVFKILIDPLNVFASDTNNEALLKLKEYSDAITLQSYTDNTDKLLFDFENNLDYDKFVKVLLNRTDDTDIFINEKSYDDYKIELENNIDEEISKHGLLWTGNVLALNTRYDIPYDKVEKLIKGDDENNGKYALIVTYSQNDVDFFDVNMYRLERDLEGILSNKNMTEKEVYYTKTGVAIFYDSTIGWKFASNNKEYPILSLDGIKFEQTSRENILSNWKSQYYVYKEIANSSETYKFVPDKKFVSDNTEDTRTYYEISIELFKDKNTVEFNLFNIYNRVVSKYTCIGGKHRVKAYLNPKQMYECINTKNVY